jgi:hypothetical protein
MEHSVYLPEDLHEVLHIQLRGGLQAKLPPPGPALLAELAGGTAMMGFPAGELPLRGIALELTSYLPAFKGVSPLMLAIPLPAPNQRGEPIMSQPPVGRGGHTAVEVPIGETPEHLPAISDYDVNFCSHPLSSRFFYWDKDVAVGAVLEKPDKGGMMSFDGLEVCVAATLLGAIAAQALRHCDKQRSAFTAVFPIGGLHKVSHSRPPHPTSS